MAAAPIKFRCFRCNQLLGVARSKAGTVVACPKCQVELLVPEPEDSQGRTPETSSTGSTDGGIAFDVLNIRPEDIRVEPGSSPVPAFLSPPTSVVIELPPASRSAEESVMTVETPWPVAEPTPRPARPEPPPTPPPISLMQPPPAPTRSVVEVPSLSGIQIDSSPASMRPRLASTPTFRSRDLVLPRSIVASWSLLVLFAVAFAFMAGLLAGHYVWRVH